MPTIQISKLQMRRGPESDLPNPSLDDGELGFADDNGRLFIGQTTPTLGQPNYNRNTFPYQNIEILTESSPLDQLLAPAFADNRLGFIPAVALTLNPTFTDGVNLQVLDSTLSPVDFNVDLSNGGANAIISYFVYDTTVNPLRVGKLIVSWNTTMVTEPLCVDEAYIPVGNIDDIKWKAILVGSFPNQHVVLQYVNATGVNATVFFRIDRPFLS